MAKYYTFVPSATPEEGLNVLQPTRVWGESMKDAAQKLRMALGKDPKLEGEHKEFNAPEAQEPKPKSTPKTAKPNS